MIQRRGRRFVQGIAEEFLEQILRATINTWHGLLAAARTEAAFRKEIVLLVIAVPLAFCLLYTSPSPRD